MEREYISVVTDPPAWARLFDDRQRGLIFNCRMYAESKPSGLPGHQLMLIIAQMAAMLDRMENDGVDKS